MLGAEAMAFALASLIHRGGLLPGYAHGAAATAETVIAAVLLAGLALSWILPRRIRAIGLAAQGFALLGTLAGLAAIAGGVGPQTALDLAYHAIMVAALAAGLAALARAGGRHAAV
ncbi:hypothetical protein P409_17035 [Inquilinus limosus MP06]|uniref:Uncharacterized protein n=2 Tax=Inquilinus limosus TaxID=171674 RepID=A0A0A0D5U1_9PROT|nr:hypothetical protein P409_17035 [Inquilinus limosus MP06]